MRDVEMLVVFASLAYGLGVTFLLLKQGHLSFWERVLYFVLSPVVLPLLLVLALGQKFLGYEDIDDIDEDF
jgi:hypothetical protein